MQDVQPWLTLRELYGLTQTAVAAQAGINQSHYSHIERDRTQPAGLMVAKLVAVLPPPSGLSRTRIVTALEKGPSSTDRDLILPLVAALAEYWPQWANESLTALGYNGAVLSAAAQPGLVWLILKGAEEFVPPDLLEPAASIALGETAVARWSALVSQIHTRSVVRQGTHVVSQLIEVRQVDPLTWDAVYQGWSRLTPAQRAALANLVSVFLDKE
ncbi:MAG: helix-turn-helix transcriptional regulator [Thermaerobacter sp.]|nr:helix-turn-helix transcriptional regulator [Thermaerobacter sp.]